MPAFPTIGELGAELNGAECRLLRASLCLERRHVAGIASANWSIDGELVTLAQVTSWERSRARGYPDSIARLLRSLSQGIDNFARVLASSSDVGPGWLERPSRAEAKAELRPYGEGACLDEEDLRVGRSTAGFTGQAADLWDVLTDAAMVRAALTFPAGVRVANARADQSAPQETGS